MAAIANQRWISICNIIIYLEAKIRPNQRILYFGGHKMKRFQWKWIFTGNKTCCTIWRPFWFAIAAILNPKWSPRYKNPPIWAKFCFQVD
jgi:hypothetical protein